MQSVFCRAARRLVITQSRIICGPAATVGNRRIALNRYSDAPSMGVECGYGVHSERETGRCRCLQCDRSGAADGGEWRRGRKRRLSAVAPRSSDTIPVTAMERRCHQRDGAHSTPSHDVLLTAGAGQVPTSTRIATIWPSWQTGQMRSETPVRASSRSR